MLDAGHFKPVAQEDREVHLVRVVGRVGVDDPLQESHAPSRRVASAVVDTFLERLPHEVGDEQRHPAGAAVLERGLHHRPEVGLGRHVADGVMDVHRVECPTEAYRADVADHVLAFRVDLPAHL